MVLIEICTDSVENTFSAIDQGADRIELCARLDVGGLTPSMEDFLQITGRNGSKIPIFVMIRCRAGGFVYSDDEKRLMLEDAVWFVANGAEGIVTGALLNTGRIDHSFVAEIGEAVRRVNPDVQITFHKAFDSVVLQEGESLADVAKSIFPTCDRILTSGGPGIASAVEGIDSIHTLVAETQDKPIIVVAGSIRPSNVGEVILKTSAREIHSRCPLICGKQIS